MGRALRAAADPAPAGRPGPARRQERARASTPTRSPTRATSRRRSSSTRRGDVAIAVARQPAGQLALARGHRGARARRGSEVERPARKAMILASPNPALFCAGADIKAFTKMDEACGPRAARRARTTLLRSMGAVAHDDDRRGQRPRASAAAASWRWPATSASPAYSATFGQPEINLGDHPRLRRHAAAAAARRAGQGARDEPDRRADLGRARPTSTGSSTASCPTTSCSTPRWPGRASSPARRRSRSSRSSSVSHAGRPRRGHRGREGGLRRRRSPPRTRARASAPSSASARRSSRAM